MRTASHFGVSVHTKPVGTCGIIKRENEYKEDYYGIQ